MIVKGYEGITHINVYSKSTLDIGRWLSNFSYSPITTEEGLFNSVEAYWYWLGTLHDPLRKLHGYSAKKLGKSVEMVRQYPEELFKEKICKAIDLKLKLKPLEVSKINLPLCHYYIYGDKRVDAGYEWIVEHIEKRVLQLKKHYEKLV